MIKTSQPALHGDQHCPDGSDPIPCLLTAPAAGGTYPEAVLAHPCLVHYWPADEPSGNLIDRKGSWDLSVETAVVGGVTYPQYGAAGPFTELPDLTAVVNAGQYGVSAADAHFYNNSATVPTGTAPFTVEVWAYLTDYGTVATAEIVNTGNFTITMVTRKLAAAKGAASVTDPADFPLNAWQHLVARYDGTTIALFRNAALVDSDTAGSAASSSPLSWMNVHTGPSFSPWRGRSAQLAIYDCALSDAEIAAHYELRDVGANAAAGLVLTTDGEGGTDWEFPTVKVDGTRYDEILSGTGLTSTDNTDGTVTLDATGGGAPTGVAGGVLDGTYPNPGLAASVAGAGLAETSDVLSVNVDGTTLEISSDSLRVKADGITASQIATNAVGASELASTTVSSGSYGDATHVAQFTVDADGRLTAAANVTLSTPTFDPATATTWWFPLADSDGLLVLDDNGALIPTLIPLA